MQLQCLFLVSPIHIIHIVCSKVKALDFRMARLKSTVNNEIQTIKTHAHLKSVSFTKKAIFLTISIYYSQLFATFIGLVNVELR